MADFPEIPRRAGFNDAWCQRFRPGTNSWNFQAAEWRHTPRLETSSTISGSDATQSQFRAAIVAARCRAPDDTETGNTATVLTCSSQDLGRPFLSSVASAYFAGVP